jgi:membrane protein DedA with SNARE-associated domain
LRLRPIGTRSRYIIAIGIAFVASISIIFSDAIEDTVTGIGSQLSSGGLQSLTGTLTNAIVGIVSSLNYLGVFVLMLLESTSLPVPSEVVLPFAGYLVSTGKLEFWLVVLLATGSGVIGSLIDYYIGLYLGLRTVSNYGSRFFISPEQMARVESLFKRHGGLVILLSRLIPGIRTLASFPAGSARMSVPKFVVYTALGCFVFDTALVYVGDYLGAHWKSIRTVGTLEIAATVVAILVGAWLFLRLQRKQPSSQSSGATPA